MSRGKPWHCAILLVAVLVAACAHKDAAYSSHVGAQSSAEASAIRVAMRAYGLSSADAGGYDISVQSEKGSGNVFVLISPHYEPPAGSIRLGDPTGRAIEFVVSPTGRVL